MGPMTTGATLRIGGARIRTLAWVHTEPVDADFTGGAFIVRGTSGGGGVGCEIARGEVRRLVVSEVGRG